MFELALFPLNAVLFPGMPIAIHVFEPRYRQMLAMCLERREAFGVLLIRHGQEARGPLPEPYDIGCTADIVKAEPLSDGRMFVLASGRDRIRVLAVDRSRLYLVGTVEPYPLTTGDAALLASTAARLRPLVARYLQALANTGEARLTRKRVPSDPVPLAYLAATLLRIPPAQKQSLLQIQEAGQLLDDLTSTYRRELALVRAMGAQREDLRSDTVQLN